MEHKFYKAVLRTKKTEEQVREQYKGSIGPPPTDEEIQNTMKFYELLDGITAIVSPTLSLTPGEYAYLSATDAYADQEKEAFWMMEQDPYFGAYIDRREYFNAAWDDGEYCPSATLHLKADEVEILEEV